MDNCRWNKRWHKIPNYIIINCKEECIQEIALRKSKNWNINSRNRVWIKTPFITSQNRKKELLHVDVICYIRYVNIYRNESQSMNIWVVLTIPTKIYIYIYYQWDAFLTKHYGAKIHLWLKYLSLLRNGSLVDYHVYKFILSEVQRVRIIGIVQKEFVPIQ